MARAAARAAKGLRGWPRGRARAVDRSARSRPRNARTVDAWLMSGHGQRVDLIGGHAPLPRLRRRRSALRAHPRRARTGPHLAHPARPAGEHARLGPRRLQRGRARCRQRAVPRRRPRARHGSPRAVSLRRPRAARHAPPAQRPAPHRGARSRARRAGQDALPAAVRAQREGARGRSRQGRPDRGDDGAADEPARVGRRRRLRLRGERGRQRRCGPRRVLRRRDPRHDGSLRALHVHVRLPALGRRPPAGDRRGLRSRRQQGQELGERHDRQRA